MSQAPTAALPALSIDYARPSTPPPPPSRLRLLLSRIAIIALLFDISLGALLYGLHLRKAAFIQTSDAHFLADVRNAFRWGTVAQDKGLFNIYDAAVDDRLSGERTIDYPPLRLVAAYQWTQWAHRHYPDVTEWQNDYDLTRPMLNANTWAEFLSSVLIFLLIRLWTLRMHRANKPNATLPFFLGIPAALTGALLFWFNPAVIWDGHCWPQWDVWLIPFFLAAVLLASLDWWFTAGICIMIGASLKGQMLLCAPVLLLWPLCAARFASALKLIFGFLFATAIIALPWMHLQTRPIIWLILTAISTIILIPLTWQLKLPFISKLPTQQKNQDQLLSSSRPSRLRGNPSFLQLPILLLLALLLSWPWASHEKFSTRILALLPLALLIIARFFPRNLKPATYAGVFAGAILLTIPLFNADSNWYTIGFKYGTEKFDYMITGSGAWNIAKMQQVYFSTYNRPDDLFMIPFTQTTVTNPFTKTAATYRDATLTIYAVALLLCSAGAAWHARRRRPDTRFLAAIATPWLCAFMILSQMHGRYTVWAAGLSALLAGVSVGLSLLGVLLSLIATLGIMENQYLFVRDYDPDTLRTLQALDPHLGWILLLIMGIFLYTSATPRRQLL
jgi:hypothetical protein